MIFSHKFKIGDRVVLKEAETEIHCIIEGLDAITTSNDVLYRITTVEPLNTASGSHFFEKNLKLDVQYYRDQKLKDILDV